MKKSLHDQAIEAAREEIITLKAMIACVDNYNRVNNLRILRRGPHVGLLDRHFQLVLIRQELRRAIAQLEGHLPENIALYERLTPVIQIEA